MLAENRTIVLKFNICLDSNKKKNIYICLDLSLTIVKTETAIFIVNLNKYHGRQNKTKPIILDMMIMYLSVGLTFIFEIRYSIQVILRSIK